MSITFHQHTLPNGLQIIAEVDPHAHTTAIGFFVKAGARDEQPGIMGVSHFLEHMMFKGTETRTAEDVDRQFDSIGANHNAFTTSELTAFYAHCLPEGLGEATDILSDILRPALRPDDFDQEKSVILEEIAMYQDQPFWVLYERAMETYYGSHPLGHRVLGTADTVSEMTQPEMLQYFSDHYSADNTVVAVAGRVDFDQVCAQIAERCGHWARTDIRRQHLPVEFRPQQLIEASATAHQHYLVMMCPGPALEDDRRYAAATLMQILGEPDGSRLYWALIDTGLADEAHAQYHGRDGTGEMIVYCSSSPEQADTILAAAQKEIDHLVESLTEDDLERVKSKIATGATLQSELPAGRMRRLGQLWTYIGEYRSLELELERINAVQLSDLRKLAEDFPLDQWMVGKLVGEDGDTDG